MKRTLTLRRETLAELAPAELMSVAGANAITIQGFTCPLLASCPLLTGTETHTCTETTGR